MFSSSGRATPSFDTRRKSRLSWRSNGTLWSRLRSCGSPRETETSRNCSGCLGLRKRSARSTQTEAQRPSTPASRIQGSWPCSRPTPPATWRNIPSSIFLNGQLQRLAAKRADLRSKSNGGVHLRRFSDGGSRNQQRIHDGLADDGHLFLDHGEIFWGSDWVRTRPGFDPVRQDDRVADQPGGTAGALSRPDERRPASLHQPHRSRNG